MSELAGKTALVTGGGNGIGRATAELLGKAGAQVFVADIHADNARTVAAGIPGAEALVMDVTSPQAFAETFALIEASAGKLDILVNNAGAGGTQSAIADMQVGEWDHTMDLLLRSVMLGIHHAVPLMKAAGGGSIINTASVASFQAGMSPIAYAVAKAGVLHMTKVAAAELARFGIRVNAVCPGMILTGIYTNGLGDYPELAGEVDEYMAGVAPKAQPIAKPGLPEDVAQAIAYFAGRSSSFVTGTHLLVDGGMLVGPRHSWDPDFKRPAAHPLAKLAAEQAGADA